MCFLGAGLWGVGCVILVQHNLSIVPPVELNLENYTLVSSVTHNSVIDYFSSIIRQTLAVCRVIRTQANLLLIQITVIKLSNCKHELKSLVPPAESFVPRAPFNPG